MDIDIKGEAISLASFGIAIWLYPTLTKYANQYLDNKWLAGAAAIAVAYILARYAVPALLAWGLHAAQNRGPTR